MPLSCTANAGVPPVVRAEGEAELVADLILVCTGGAPTIAGAAVPTADFSISFNTNVTSQIPASPFSEALLFIGEPHSGVSGTPNTLLPCGAPGSNEIGGGVCSIISDGSWLDTYNGSPGHPNVFQGQVSGPNSITWSGVPVDGTSNAGFLLLHFTNLRLNASMLGTPAPGSPSEMDAFISVTGDVVVNDPSQLVAYGQSSLATTSSATALLSPCIGANPSIASNPANALDTGAQFSISQTELAPAVWRAKNIAQLQADGASFHTSYPADLNQNVLGYSYFTETGFFNGSAVDPNLPGILPTPEFPAVRGLNTAGLAATGTRVYFQFSPVPNRLQLFVPVKLALTDSARPTTQTGVAVLTSTDADGAGPYSPVLGNASGLAPVPISNGNGLVVYEVLVAANTVQENLTVPVAAAFLPNQVTGGTVNVQSGLAPLVSLASSPVPRFVASTNSTVAFTMQACAQNVGSSLTASPAVAIYSPRTQRVTLTASVITPPVR